ncbi:hypothetical protein CONCODRAFT_12668, partial [Conidiobolus coronatus NRRL 28638]
MKVYSFLLGLLLIIKSCTGTVIELSAVQAEILTEPNSANGTSAGGLPSLMHPQIMLSVPHSNGGGSGGNNTEGGNGTTGNGVLQLGSMPNLEKMIEQINSAVQSDISALSNSSSQVTPTSITVAAQPTTTANATSSEKKKSEGSKLHSNALDKLGLLSLGVGIIVGYTTASANDNNNNNESIRLHVAALKDQATNLVNQINLMIDSHLNLLPTSTTAYFSTEPSVTFLVRPQITSLANSDDNDSMSATPANSADTNLPTPTSFSSTSANSNTQTFNSLPSSTSTTSQLPTSTLSTIDLFPLNTPASTSRRFSIGQDKGNNTAKSETLV